MKLLFLSLIVIVNGVCYGQKKDTILDRFYFLNDSMKVRKFVTKNGFAYADTVLTDELKGITIWGTPLPPPINNIIEFTKQDTIACLMLVCDTLKRASGYMWFDSTGAKGEEILNTSPEVWWKPGFVIYKYYQRNGWDVQEPIYLDRRKKPLDSWIVVWMVKEIN